MARHDDTQATNPFSSGEVHKRLGQSQVSGTTNPFTTQDLKDRLPSLEGHSPGQAPGPAAEHSGATNPFTSQEIRDRLDDEKVTEPLEAKPSAGARLFLKSVQPEITARLLEGNPRNLQLDFKAPLPGEHVLAVAQEPGRIHVGIAVSGPDPRLGTAPKALAAIYFDPESDIVILENTGHAGFGVAPEGAAMTQSHIVYARGRHAISPGTWSLHVKSGGSWTRVIHMTVMQRDFFTFNTGDKTARHGSTTKRAIEDDEGGARGQEAVKRQRSARPGTAVDITLRPPESRAVAGSSATARDKKPQATIAQLGNPLLKLKDGGSVTFDDTRGAVYTLTRTQGILQTGASAVFKAVKSDLPGKVVAVKVFRIRSGPRTGEKAHYAAIAQACWAMEREIEVHRGLKHDRIVELYSVDSRVMALYLEYVEGPSLADERWCPRPGCMFRGDVEDARRILADTARGLEFLHAKGIVHNDLKPGNLLYSRKRGAVICDLGLSGMTGRACNGGSPWYVPPENLNKHHVRVGADDCWALGVIGLFALRETMLPERAAAMWQIAEITTPNSTARKLATEWYEAVLRIREGLDKMVVQGVGPMVLGTGTETVLCGDASRDRLVQCVVRLTDSSPEGRPTPSGVLEMLGDATAGYSAKLSS